MSQNYLLENPSSVHTPSTTVHNAPRTYRARCLAHVPAGEVEAVRRFYDSENLFFAVGRLDSCRSYAWFARNMLTEKVSVLSKSCHVRFCPMCSRSRSAVIYGNTLSWLKVTKNPKMLTLTLKHTDCFLAGQLDDLYNAFKSLRRLKLWTSRVTGLVWFFELKLNAKNEWHPHLHVLIDGEYIPQRQLRRAWEQETGDSYIVDIRAVKENASAAAYVAKYATKPILIRDIPSILYREVLSAFHRRRLCGAAGSAKTHGVLTKPKIVTTDWVRLGSWSVVINAKSQNADAAAIYKCFITGQTIDRYVSCQDIDDFIDDIQPPLLAKKNRIDIEPTFF